jgi:hypothetical protein
MAPSPPLLRESYVKITHPPGGFFAFSPGNSRSTTKIAIPGGPQKFPEGGEGRGGGGRKKKKGGKEGREEKRTLRSVWEY